MWVDVVFFVLAIVWLSVAVAAGSFLVSILAGVAVGMQLSRIIHSVKRS